jgi:hypothetical protein
MAATWMGSFPPYPTRVVIASETSNPAPVMVKCASIVLMLSEASSSPSAASSSHASMDGDRCGASTVGHGGETPVAAYVVGVDEPGRGGRQRRDGERFCLVLVVAGEHNADDGDDGEDAESSQQRDDPAAAPAGLRIVGHVM